MTDLLTIYGTEEPPVPRQSLAAGPLTADLEAGQLRDIRWHGVLVLRGIAYLLRDADWGTLTVDLADLVVDEGPDAFAVTYTAAAPGLSYRAEIKGQASGHLHFAVTARANADFVTNRTGFVVLHPDTAAGGALTVTHTNGQIEATEFPARILPDQPAFDIAALLHHPVPGISATTSFDGGVFEMEDQRNWADASFKTYVRPVAWPRPYVIPAGIEESQGVRLTLTGNPTTAANPANATGSAGTVPPLWLRLDHDEPVPERLCLPGLAHGLILRSDTLPDPARLAAATALAAREGMRLAIEVALPARDPEGEARALAYALGSRSLDWLFVSLARDAKTRQSGSLPAGEAPFDEMTAALQTALPDLAFAFGTPAFFTEFNRNPPPSGEAAFFSVAATVHAADDLSVIETLGVLPEIVRSAALRCPGAKLIPGPLTIAPTISPYAPALARTDGTTRTCMAPQDPRHHALFGAAHLVGTLAALASEVGALAPAFATGPWGMAAPDGVPLPLAHVHAVFAAARGLALRRAIIGETWAEIEWDGGGLAANLTAGVAAPPSGDRYTHRLGDEGWVQRSAGSKLGPFDCVWSNRS